MRGTQVSNPAFIAMLQGLRRRERAQACLSLPRPRGSWRAVPGILFPAEGLRGRGEVSAADARGRKTWSSELTSRGQERLRIRQEHQMLWKGRWTKETLGSPNSTKISQRPWTPRAFWLQGLRP